MNHLPKMIRTPYEEVGAKFNLETAAIEIIARNDARRTLRRDACTLVNYTGSTRRVTFYALASGESAVDANIIGILDVKAYETLSIPEWVIKGGWALWAKADGNTAVNLCMGYNEESKQ